MFLIIQELNDDLTSHDDSAAGGDIVFEFCEPVYLQAGKILDIDGSDESANITIFYADSMGPTLLVLLLGRGSAQFYSFIRALDVDTHSFTTYTIKI